MNAQLMIFSGRPDPEFLLSEEAVADLADRLSQVIQVTPSQPPPEGGLGYRGFRVLNNEGRAGIPGEFEVFRGVVTEIVNGDTRNWADTAGVETLLIEQARAAELGGLLDEAGLDQGIA